MSHQGMVATSQPLAVDAAINVLREGGNAVDAAVCAAAMLNVVEPMSTSIGGDCFAIVYEAKTGKLYGINGSGRTPKAASIEAVKAAGHQTMPQQGILSVSVPGALHAWQALLDKLGTKPLAEMLQPAIQAAADGFELTPIIARDWAAQQRELEQGVNTQHFLPNGCPPQLGERFKQPDLAQSLTLIAEQGIQAFYEGSLADAMVAQSEKLNGWLTHEDFATHTSEWVEPITTDYRGFTVCQLPPNGQGVITLEALNILEGYDLASMSLEDRTHIQIEALKLAFADAWQYVADLALVDVPTDGLISKAYAEQRRQLIGEDALQDPTHGFPDSGTIYVTVVDQEGNAASFINSIYMHFGSKVVAEGTGIVLQNRAALSSLDPNHPNALESGKRPYHTIIPPMVLKDGKPYLCFGVVGGFQQPQAQVQILNHMLDLGADVETALNAPRFRWMEKAEVTFESEFDRDVTERLKARGHGYLDGSGFGGFGGAQAIQIDSASGELSGASDPRKDGCVKHT